MFFYHKRAGNYEEETSFFPSFLDTCDKDIKSSYTKAILSYHQLLACNSPNFSKEEIFEFSLFLGFGHWSSELTSLLMAKIKNFFNMQKSNSLEEIQDKIANYFEICLHDISSEEIPYSILFLYPEYQFYKKGIFQFLKNERDYNSHLVRLSPSNIIEILLYNGYPICKKSAYPLWKYSTLKKIYNLDPCTQNYLNLAFELYTFFHNPDAPITLYFVLAFLGDSALLNPKERQEILAFFPSISWEEFIERFPLKYTHHYEWDNSFRRSAREFQIAILELLKKLEKKQMPCSSLSIFLESLESCINFSHNIGSNDATKREVFKGISLLRERVSYLYTFHMIEKPFQRFQDIPKEIEEKKKALLSMQINSHISIYDLQKLRVSFENVILNLLMQTNSPFFSSSQDDIFIPDTIYNKILNLKLKIFHKEALPKKYNFQKVHEMVCNMDQSKIQEAITILESLLEFTEFFLKHYAEWVRLLQPHCEFSFSPSSLSLLRCLYMELQACLSEFTTSSLLECTDHYIENFCKNNIALKKKR